MEPTVINAWSRIRKLICVLSIALMLTAVMFRLAEAKSEYLQMAIAPYSTAMVLLAFSYVSDSILRIVAERLPIPAPIRAMLEK